MVAGQATTASSESDGVVPNLEETPPLPGADNRFPEAAPAARPGEQLPAPKRRRVPSAPMATDGDVDTEEPVGSSLEDEADDAEEEEATAEGEQVTVPPLPAEATEDELVWSAVVEIDPGFPFDAVWPTLKGSVYRALRSVHTTWPKMGWRSSDEMEISLRRGVETSGSGAIARGLQKTQAEQVAKELQGEVPCLVCVDREGAAAAPDDTEPAPGPQAGGAADPERRERIRQRIRDLRDRAAWRLPLDPMFADILGRIERDIEDDGQWLSVAPAMERALDLMQAHEAVGHLLGGRLLQGGRLCHGLERSFKISVDRNRLLSSALCPVLAADPEELRKGRLHVKYRGEEGEDGEGGGGVTRAFLTDAGRLLMDTRLGLLLPAPGGHFHLSSIPGCITRRLHREEDVSKQPEQWASFFGRLLGMAVSHECPLGLVLTPALCKSLLGQEPTFDDLMLAPGMNDSDSGWHASLRSLLAHHAPELVPEAGTLVRLETSEVDAALEGLEATMPSRRQLVFEALAAHVAGAAGSPHLWEEAVDVATCLLHTAAPAQRRSVLDRLLTLLHSIESNRALLTGEQLPRALLSLGTALRASGACESCSGQQADELLRTLLDGHCDEVPEFSRLAVAEKEDEETEAAADNCLRSLRPRHVPSISDWFTTGAKEQMRDSGKFYHEVKLGEDFEDFFDPQLGWLTNHFEERDYDANGVGDDQHGWAADGVRNTKWHDGPADAKWPRPWRGSDVIGFALDIEAGLMRFSLNGEWVDPAQMQFEAAGRSLYPAVSMKGRFAMHLPRVCWQFRPPDDSYHAWASAGVFTRPVQLASPLEDPLAFERQHSEVSGPGLADGEPLSSANLRAYAEAVTRKALVENAKPYLELVVQEFGRVVTVRTRKGLTWQQVQERISGQRLDAGAFVSEWQSRTSYQCPTGSVESNQSVALWWDHVSDRSAEELHRLFAWCTGFAAIPVTAWKFQIKVVDDEGQCPTVNTCMTDDPSAANRGVKMPTLYLPAYTSRDVLEHRMEWALAAAAGMHLH